MDKNEFKTGALPAEAILQAFDGLPEARESARLALHAHGLILQAFQAMDRQLSPLVEIHETMAGFGFAQEMGRSMEMNQILRTLSARDQEIQKLGAKGLAMGLVAVDLALDKDGAGGDDRDRLCCLLRDSCIQALPARCAQPWTDYCRQVEIMGASMRTAPAAASEPPRL